MGTLVWMSNKAISKLNETIIGNIERYRSGDFCDLVDSSWDQKALLEYDSDRLRLLSGESKNDLHDSVIFFEMFSALPPRLATCLNIWVPLIHGELLHYARARWLKPSFSDEELEKAIRSHVFRSGVGGYRDDNVAGRLWWTGYIGSQIAGVRDADKIKEALKPFMRTTDTRMTVIERSGLFSESRFALAISQYLAEGRFPESQDQNRFRDFVVNVNLKSNGRYFGDLTRQEVFEFLDQCR